MKHEARDGGISGPLIDAAGLVADGSDFDLLSLSSSLVTDEDRAIADELAAVARIAHAHRKLHQVLPQPEPGSGTVPFAASWGHLDLIEVVGRGSYGTVYRAWDPRLDRQVALKLFHGARNPEAVMHEGRMLARIRHENVVTVYGADVYNGIAGIWMEFVHGRRLDQIVEHSGPLSVEETVRVGVAVCRALVAVHGAGLLHCDVKAQNVIREVGGRIVLMDLGAGRETMREEDDSAAVQVAGTPRYMAPEVFDRGNALAQSDVYSVGVLLFYLSTGKFPVDGKTLSDIRRAHLEARRARITDYRPDLPQPFVQSITRALDPTPAARHATPGELETELVCIPDGSERPAPRRRIGFKTVAASIALLVALTGLLAWNVARSTSTPIAAPLTTRSLAVLPIRNLTGDASKAYLADGLTEVFISNLARVHALRVPSSGAVAAFRDRSEPAPEMGKKLGVDLLLAGSILDVSDRARMVIQLIDAPTDTVLWSEELTAAANDLLSVPGDVTRLVARRLSIGLSEPETRAVAHKQIDTRAQEAYLRGVITTGASIQDVATAMRAQQHMREAIAIAPDFADAWAELANIELSIIERANGVDRKQGAAAARQLAERALQLDPSSARGYEALGTVQFYHDWDFQAAEQTYRAALDARPSSASIRQILSMLLAAQRRLPEAIAVAEEGRSLEPLMPVRTTSVGILYYYARDFARAETEMLRALEISPDFRIAHFGLGRIYSAMGRHGDAIRHFTASLGNSRPPAYVVELARAHVAAGQHRESEQLLRELARRKGNGEGYSHDNHAYIAAAAGKPDEAFAILNRAIDERLANVLWIDVDPRVDPLRSDPRFPPLLARIGLRR